MFFFKSIQSNKNASLFTIGINNNVFKTNRPMRKSIIIANHNLQFLMHLLHEEIN